MSSSPLDDLQKWLEANDPETMPFFPGARETTPFGVRPKALEGTSPIHVGRDRAHGGDGLKMPFDGTFEWRKTGHAFGSVTDLIAQDLPLVVQVGHCEADDENIRSLGWPMRRGEDLEVVPGNLGSSHGAHTHTEVHLPYDDEIWDWLCVGADWIVDRAGRVNPARVPESMRTAARRQVASWGILEMNEHGAVMVGLPDYRAHSWRGKLLLVDTGWLLQI